jgi:hypothetical protein
MSDIQINKIWDYLLSNSELTASLGIMAVSKGGKIDILKKCRRPSLTDAQEIKLKPLYECTTGHNVQLGSYGTRTILDKNGKILISPAINGIINLVYFKNIETAHATLSFMNNYQMIPNEHYLGIKIDENLDSIFKNLINNLENQDLRNIIKFTKNDINNNTLVIKNKPINAIIYLEMDSNNYYLSFPVGSNIILIVYDSHVNCIIAFNNDTDIVCPAEKICPEKVCPVNITPYIFISILIIIVFTLAIFLILKKK